MAVVCNICGGKAFVNEYALRQHSLENKKHRQREAELRAQQAARTPTLASVTQPVQIVAPTPVPAVASSSSVTSSFTSQVRFHK